MSESVISSPAAYGAAARHLQVVRPEVCPPAPSTGSVPAPRGPQEPPAWAGRLSLREVEVLHCIAAGMSTVETAEALFISVATVKSHIARLIMKVEVRDRVQLVVAAYRTRFVALS